MLYESVGFALVRVDVSAVFDQDFIRAVGCWGAIERVDDLPHLGRVLLLDGVFEEVGPLLLLGFFQLLMDLLAGC